MLVNGTSWKLNLTIVNLCAASNVSDLPAPSLSGHPFQQIVATRHASRPKQYHPLWPGWFILGAIGLIGWPANHLPTDDVQMIIVWNCKGNQSNIRWNEVKGVRPPRSKVRFCHWYVMYCHVYVRWCWELSHMQSRTPTNSNKEECLFNSFPAQEYCWQARTICPKLHLTAPVHLSAAACTAGWPRKFLPR